MTQAGDHSEKECEDDWKQRSYERNLTGAKGTMGLSKKSLP